jgi:regulator of sirC expression with transglutaminase-like and TPR domain
VSDPAPEPHDLRARLAELGAAEDDAIEIGRAALWLGALDRPQVGLARYEDHLADLGNALDTTLDDMAGKTQALQKLMQSHGYAGDAQTYDDEQNANLLRVIDRRKGLPVSLAILLIDAAERAGWRAVGLSFPYHFLIRLDHGAERNVIDPFNGGNVVTTAHMRELLKSFDGNADLGPAHYQPVGKRAVLLRLQNNIKSRAVEQRRFDRAADLLERMLLFAPHEAGLWRELGVLQVACGRVKDAVSSAERYYGMADNEEQRHDAAMLVQKIKSRLN